MLSPGPSGAARGAVTCLCVCLCVSVCLCPCVCPQVPAPASCRPPGATGEALRREIEELRQKELALDQEIAQLLSECVLGSAVSPLFWV